MVWTQTWMLLLALLLEQKRRFRLLSPFVSSWLDCISQTPWFYIPQLPSKRCFLTAAVCSRFMGHKESTPGVSICSFLFRCWWSQCCFLFVCMYQHLVFSSCLEGSGLNAGIWRLGLLRQDGLMGQFPCYCPDSASTYLVWQLLFPRP